ncbi:MAG TPA: hypothetical protein VIX37_12765, partial [Candidatus Sulfotelmatobacter sp.]
MNIPNQIDLKDFFTTIGALVGTTLGLYNTWQAHHQKRIKLRLVPKLGSDKGVCRRIPALVAS